MGRWKWGGAERGGRVGVGRDIGEMGGGGKRGSEDVVERTAGRWELG